MTEKDKKTIQEMRAAGISYKAISEKTGINVSTLKMFVHRHEKPEARRCLRCGKLLPEGARQTQRFCSQKCKSAWWKKNPNQEENENRIARLCAFCGKQFISYNKAARYCSRACYRQVIQRDHIRIKNHLRRLRRILWAEGLAFQRRLPEGRMALQSEIRQGAEMFHAHNNRGRHQMLVRQGIQQIDVGKDIGNPGLRRLSCYAGRYF